MLSEDIVKKLLDESEIEYMDFPDGNSAFGIYIENAVFVFHDAQMCVKSYPDTGVFLFWKAAIQLLLTINIKNIFLKEKL